MKRRWVGLGVVLVILGCSSVPTLKFETEGFLTEYVNARDEFRDQTYPARMKCRRLDPAASDALKVRCAELAVKQAAWAQRDKVVLHAIVTQSTITNEQVAAAAAAVKDVLGVALTIAPALAAL